jgi:hypothetical protein
MAGGDEPGGVNRELPQAAHFTESLMVGDAPERLAGRSTRERVILGPWR